VLPVFSKVIHLDRCCFLWCHPLALKIKAEFPDLDLCVWYLDDGTIIGQMDDVYTVF